MMCSFLVLDFIMEQHAFLTSIFQLYKNFCNDDRNALIILNHWIMLQSSCYNMKDQEVNENLFIFFHLDLSKILST